VRVREIQLPLTLSYATAPEDSEIEVANMRPGIGQLKVFPSIWGHWAGGEFLFV
jgi:hypothetical protein